MSKTVGHLTPFKGQSGEGYKGELTLHSCRGQIALKPVEEKRSDRSPDFTVLIDREGQGNGWQEYGLAWVKKPANKTAYLSILIDHESLPAPYNVAAFPPLDTAKDPRHVIVWGRPRGGKVALDAASTLPDDEIPF